MAKPASPSLTILSVVDATAEAVEQCQQELKAKKSPQTLYEDAVASIQSQIDEAFHHLSSATELTDKDRLREEIVAFGGRLTELRYRHEQDFAEDERRYHEEQSRILQNLCSKMVSIVGRQTMQQAIQSLESGASPCESAQSLEPTDVSLKSRAQTYN